MEDTLSCHISSAELSIPSKSSSRDTWTSTYKVLTILVAMIVLDLIIGEFYFGRARRGDCQNEVYTSAL
jgi:hypothetical protein